MEKSKKQLADKLKALEKKMTGKDYVTKVPENVRLADGEKCESMKSELTVMEKAMSGIKTMLN